MPAFCDTLHPKGRAGMVYSIEQIRRITQPIAAAYGIRSMRLFGSYARGEATEDSDVDILIDKGAYAAALYLAACMPTFGTA